MLSRSSFSHTFQFWENSKVQCKVWSFQKRNWKWTTTPLSLFLCLSMLSHIKKVMWRTTVITTVLYSCVVVCCEYWGSTPLSLLVDKRHTDTNCKSCSIFYYTSHRGEMHPFVSPLFFANTHHTSCIIAMSPYYAFSFLLPSLSHTCRVSRIPWSWLQIHTRSTLKPSSSSSSLSSSRSKSREGKEEERVDEGKREEESGPFVHGKCHPL